MTHQIPVIQHQESVFTKALNSLDSWRLRALVLGVGVSGIALLVTVILPSGNEVETAPGASAAVQDGISGSSLESFAALFQPRESIPAAPARTAPVVGAPSEPVSPPVEVVPPVAPTDNVLHPTPAWVNVFSPESTFEGEPLTVGDVITAYDQQGVLIGRTEVQVTGKYGLMALYMDDPTTTLDEGASPGETINFRVNDILAQVLGPHEPVWGANGDVLMLNLAVQS